MFAVTLPLIVPALCAGIATDPLVAAQLRYPVYRTTVTTASGSVVYYTLPRDVPLELKRAYKVLEFAEREAILSESLQLLQLDYVRNERRLEAVRTNALAAAYMNFPGNRGQFYYRMPAAAPPSALKQYLSLNLARNATFERSLQAIDQLALAQYQVQQAWVSLAYPDQKPVAAPPPPAVPRP